MRADTSDLTPLPELPPGRYHHYKGGEYEVFGVARHSETHEALVVYRPLYNDSGWWVRPHAMFVENVTIDGTTRPRFERVAEVQPSGSAKHESPVASPHSGNLPSTA